MENRNNAEQSRAEHLSTTKHKETAFSIRTHKRFSCGGSDPVGQPVNNDIRPLPPQASSGLPEHGAMQLISACRNRERERILPQSNIP
jgi:hypothetical protein